MSWNRIEIVCQTVYLPLNVSCSWLCVCLFSQSPSVSLFLLVFSLQSIGQMTIQWNVNRIDTWWAKAQGSYMRIAYEAMCVRVCMLVGSNNVTNNQYLLALLRMNVWPKYLLKNIKHKIIFWKYSKFQKCEQILISSQMVCECVVSKHSK